MTTVPARALSTESARPAEGLPTCSALGGSRTAACWALYLLTLRQHFHGRRWLVMGLLFLLPAGIAVLARATAPVAANQALEFVLAWNLIPQALLPIMALVYASGIIQDEQEEQTITYLLIRPIPKWAIYVVKMVATWTTTVVLVVVLTVLTFAAIYAGAGSDVAGVPLRCIKTASIHSLAVVAYCSLFGLMSLLAKRTLVIGILYTAIVEGLFANLPFGIRLVTVIYYTRLIAYRSLDFLIMRPRGGKEDLAAVAWQLDIAKDPTLVEHPQLSTCIFTLVAASVAFTAIAAWLCSQREFHVKTPEND